MTLALRLVLYVAVTAGMFGSLAGGVWWLVTPDPLLQRPTEAKAAPIPPRIAESIERRVPVPVQEPQPVRVAPPSTPLQEANVSLTPLSAVERKPNRSRVVKAVRPARDTKSREKEPPSVQTDVAPVVTTARTDFPF